MATLFELKEHLKKGGKIKRAFWEEGEWIRLVEQSFVDEDGMNFPFLPVDAFDSDWEVYKEPIKITHTGLYKTRDGRKVFISSVDPSANFTYVLFGVIEGERRNRIWSKKGELWKNEESPEDIVSEWKD